MTASIMVVDDDASVLSALRRALVLEGYQVTTAADGEAALEMIGTSQPDLLILDVMLPGIDGFTVCSRAREMSHVPILMLTAKDTVPDRVSGLDHGADDYLVKPFAIDELMARVRALLRRQAGHSRTLQYEDLVLDLDTHEAFRGDEPLNLSPLDFQLLSVFLKHPRQVLSREQLCQQVWGFDFEGESNFVNVAVMELRRKIESEGQPRLIQTVRGFGYALRVE
ncbi:MAG: response regulator transcription factor [Chloroflexi bacterium]|nr:response regulator transcription factor [Chloroflexota bacterium]